MGFGDYAPLADHERLIGAAMLLFGVLIFSYIMGKFLEMVDQNVKFSQTLEESEALTKFFGVLNRYNNDQSFNKEIKEQIEDHFKYKWINDKNQSIREKEDL